MKTSNIFTNDNCVGCNLCILGCPCHEANVATLENGTNKIYIDKEKCIGCAECIRHCTHDARDFQDDTEKFFEDLSGGKEISLIVAPAIRSNFDHWEKLLGFFKNKGVRYVFDTSFGADICTWAYLRYITQTNQTGLISQPCPAVVNYIQRYQPTVLSKLIPIHSPAMCTAVYMRKYKKISGAYAFLSPCIAKKDEFDDENTGGLMNYNVTFQKLAQYLEKNHMDYSQSPALDFDNEAHGLGALFPEPGGLKANVEKVLPDKWIHQVEGQPLVTEFLDSYLQDPHEQPFLVDILNCPHGCNIGTGALCTEWDSLKVDRTMHGVEQRVESGKKPKHKKDIYKKFDGELQLKDFERRYHDLKVHSIPISDQDVEQAFQALYKTTDHQRKVDCRSCGYSTCHDMAQALAKGINHVENCVEYHKTVLENQKAEIQQLSQKKEQQSRELRSNVEQITSAINQSAEKTEATMMEVQAIKDKLSAMNGISTNLSEMVSTLEKEIEKYSKMSDRIVSISTQTNILALNASVEAAHAGEKGKGFAVVAEQIKILSDQSRGSAAEALSNNEIVMPLLRQVDNVSEEVLQQTGTIEHNVSSILEAITGLAAIQEEISASASSIVADIEEDSPAEHRSSGAFAPTLKFADDEDIDINEFAYDTPNEAVDDLDYDYKNDPGIMEDYKA